MPVFCVIDTGSNAIRLTIALSEKEKPVQIISICRESIRLGQDVFACGEISEGTLQRCREVFKKFRAIIDRYHVDQIRAVGTSALREAVNKDIFVREIAKASGITVLPISGTEEARLIGRALETKFDLRHKNAIVLDIGGGSTEVQLYKDSRVSATASYPLGAVRLLEIFGKFSRDADRFISEIRDYLESNRGAIGDEIREIKINLCLAAGGNVEVLGELRKELLRKRCNNFLSVDELQQIIEKLRILSYEERISQLNLRLDRADVILPAALVLEFLLNNFCLSRVIISHISLRDGILVELAEESGQLNMI